MKKDYLETEDLSYIDKSMFEKLRLEINKQKNNNIKNGELQFHSNFVKSEDIKFGIEYQLGYQRVDLHKYEVNISVITILPENMVRKYNLIAIDKKNDKLIVAMADPLNYIAVDDLKLFTKMEIQPVISTISDISKIIDKYYCGESTKRVLEEFTENYVPIGADDLDDEEQLAVTTAPVVRLLNSIIEQAVRIRASDIHIEPYAEKIRVRFRIDGDLREIMTVARSNLSAIVTRVKIIGKMNIAEKRIPQDGRVETIINDVEVDMRISTLPTVYGEKIVLRLLDKGQFNFTKEGLGFSQRNLKLFNQILAQPYGMILVTGPTGSGKTTTLYTVLRELNQIEKNIITIEDPVEYKLHGINQVQINPKSGLTFSAGLRSVLRQDPDTVMVGEIRDGETAEIAIRAAITGHLVLSTLHTNDSPSTVARLIDMGIEPYLVSSAVIGIVSQRLVKVLCDKCKKPYSASYSQKNILGIPEDKELLLYEPLGCNNCNAGYRGRAAVHELLIINEKLRKLIDTNTNIDEIRQLALEEGMTTLLQAASELAESGKTSFDEVMKVGFTLG